MDGMRLLPVVLALSLGSPLVLPLAATGCATYRDDLDRSIGHYDRHHYDRALALLVVLEPDLDSLSPAERAQYAYYRGMSHFLLEQRRDARHWLAVAAAREKLQAGLLRADEKKKTDEILAELNEERLGGATTPSAGEAPATCEADAECGEGKFCDGGRCAPAPGASPGDAPPADAPPADPGPTGKTP